jgi:hypothetical protein
MDRVQDLEAPCRDLPTLEDVRETLIEGNMLRQKCVVAAIESRMGTNRLNNPKAPFCAIFDSGSEFSGPGASLEAAQMAQ